MNVRKKLFLNQIQIKMNANNASGPEHDEGRNLKWKYCKNIRGNQAILVESS